MRTTLLSTLVAFAVVSFGPGPAQAEEVEVTYHNMPLKQVVGIYRDGAWFGSYYAGKMNLTVAGDPVPGYCIDLDHTIHAGQTWTADLLLAEEADEAYPWCQMANALATYEVTTSFEAAAMQVAMWKMVYGNLYVTQTSVEDEADAILAATDGQCTMGCQDVELTVDLWATLGGPIEGVVTVSQGGAAVAGQEVDLAISSGTLVAPAGGTGVTNEWGEIAVQIDGASMPLTVTAASTGMDLYVLEPAGNQQQLLTTYFGDPCDHFADGSLDETPMGDPRTIGFWKHQLAVWGKGKGKAQVDSGLIESWLAIEVFGTTFATMQDLYDGLWIDNKNATMEDRALQQCLATTLNVAYGELGAYTPIDYDADGADDAYLWELLAEATADFDAGDFEAAKDVCDTINNL